MFFSLNYICNFKPQLLILNNVNYLNIYVKLRSNNYILCRNFFLFLLYLKYCFKKKKFKHLSIFIQPYTQHRETILRAPYRYKLGRYQLGINRYIITCSFSFMGYNTFKIDNINQLILLNKLCKKFYPWLESNICFQHKTQHSYYISYCKNFLISNYK